jgi:succinoglycan biosynthesis transport protein ExoP
MYMTQVNPNDPRNAQPPTMPRQPLRPTPKGSALKINVLRSLRLHAVTAILVALVVLGLGLAVLLRRGLMYSSTAIIYVSPVFPKTLTADTETQYPYDSYVQQQVQAITDYKVVSDALHHLPPGMVQHANEVEQSAVQRLQAEIEVKRIGSTYEVGITMQGMRPDHLAPIVNAVTQSYLDHAKQEEFYGRDERLATLRDTRDELQKELDAKLQEQGVITRQLGVAVIGTSTPANPYDDQLNKMRSDLATAHQQRIEAEAKLSAMQSGDPSAPNSALNAEADAMIAGDPQLTALKSSMGQKRSELMNQLAGLTPNNPLRKQTEADLAQIDKGLQDMQNNLRRTAAATYQQRLRAEVNRTATIEAQLQNQLAKGTSAADTAAPRFQRADELKADIDRLQARYTAVDNRIDDLELESSSPGSVHLFSPALPPLGPEPSKTKKLIPLLIPIALIMGVAAAVAFDFFDPHLYTGADVEGVLGFAPIGSLLDDRDVTQQIFDECVLRLAAGIDHATRVAGVRTFVVTSTGSGAGTTSIVENLGSTLARLGRKTITIDASGNTNPVAYVTVGVNNNISNVPGAEFSSTNGAANGNSTELNLQTSSTVYTQSLPARVAPLSSFVAKAFQDLTNEYEIVLIDTAPLLSSAETEYLARCADVTILVTEAGKTTKGKLNRAARLLEKLDISGAAAVINKVRLIRVDDSQKHDLKEYESRMNEMNLRWKPNARKNAPVGSPFGIPSAPPVTEEPVSFVGKGERL